MERRVQLQNQKPKLDVPYEESAKVTDVSVQLGNNSKVNIVRSLAVTGDVIPCASDLVTGSPPEPHWEDGPAPRKRIKTLLPVRSSKPSPNTAKHKGRKVNQVDLSSNNGSLTSDLVEDTILDDLINQAVKEGAIISVTDSTITEGIVETKVILEPCAEPILQLTAVTANETPRSPRKMSKAHSLAGPVGKNTILPEHRRIQQLLAQKPPPREPSYLKKENLMTTSQPYLTHVREWHSGSQSPEMLADEVHVEVSSSEITHRVLFLFFYCIYLF